MNRASGIVLFGALAALPTAAPGATISGRVTDAGTGEPLELVTVFIWSGRSTGRVSSARTDAAGVYSVDGLTRPFYFAVTENTLGYYDEIYDDIPCPLPTYLTTCRPGSGAAAIDLGGGADATGVDFALERRGTLSGRVTSSRSGSPIAGVRIHVRDDRGGLPVSAKTDASGAYLAGGFQTGTYFVSVREAPGFVNEVYDDIPCPECLYRDATPVAVQDRANTPGIDFVLDRPSAIFGTVTDEETGAPVANVRVEADLRILEDRIQGDWNGVSDEEGRYEVRRLPRGSYVLRIADQAGYVAAIYDDQPCISVFGTGCDPATATPVVVAADSTVSGVDFALARGGSIAGTVRESVSGAVLGAEVVATSTDNTWKRRAGRIDAEGRYTITGLAEGVYTVVAVNGFGFLAELFDDVSCDSELEELCDPARGTPVSVSAGGELTGIDFDLDLVRGVRGRITSEADGLPLAGVAVTLTGPVQRSRRSDAEGRYFVGLPAGRYSAVTRNGLGYVDEIYDDIPCLGGTGAGSCGGLGPGTPIEIGDTTVREDVDFALGAKTCTPSKNALCLNEGRFRVTVAWQDPNGATGSGRGQRLTADSGYFWFFDPGNVELVVKLLDGCFPPAPAFWFFAAGLTNVGTEITVTDTLTGDVETYSKRPGAVFQPILDTRAFATCTARAAGTSSAPAADPRPRGSVEPDDLRLGGGGRFLVEARWRTQSGATGSAQSETLTLDSGYFWFFGPDNVEVVVKVLDACELAPFNNFWVFAAGLTNVEVRLRVTDTVSGQFKEYFNPLGANFRPVLDTSAFDTCGAR